MIVKRYSNRRLYDTDESRYITMIELAEKIRAGADVRVMDAKTGDDLTQATLTQIIVESRGAGKLLPIPLLVKMIRLGDDALAEFFGRYLTVAMEMYMQLKRGAKSVSPYIPFAQVPLDATSALARMMLGATSWMDSSGPTQEMADMRRELEEIKQAMKGKKRKS